MRFLKLVGSFFLACIIVGGAGLIYLLLLDLVNRGLLPVLFLLAVVLFLTAWIYRLPDNK
jgi:hypothetical protein